jgi:hypothetical protein
MSGVYNRKLFRKSSARDELRRMGGIMASSEELMAEAMKTAQQAPRPSGLGSMAMPAPQAPMPMQQPMMAQPMMGMPMQQPMMGQPMGMQPQQQPMMPMQQPAFMPPQLPQSLQPQGFNDGGPVIALPPAPDRSGQGGTARPRPAPESTLPYMPDLTAKIDLNPASSAVDISDPAGTYGPARSEDSRLRIFRKAEELADSVDELDPETVSEEILTTSAAEGGPEQTGDPRTDLAALYESMTGDPAAYEKNIDALNRGIIGAAIAAGTSARATENIARGMLVGMEGAKATEERRAKDAQALRIAAAEARALEAKASAEQTRADRIARIEAEEKLATAKRDVYNETFTAIIGAGVDKVTVPDGMSIEEYARNVAQDQVRMSFPDEQLLAEAREALETGVDRAKVEKRLRENGIDPGRL